MEPSYLILSCANPQVKGFTNNINDDHAICGLKDLPDLRRTHDVIVIDNAHLVFSQVLFIDEKINICDTFCKLMGYKKIEFCGGGITPLVKELIHIFRPEMEIEVEPELKLRGDIMGKERDFRRAFNASLRKKESIFLYSNNRDVLYNYYDMCKSMGVTSSLVVGGKTEHSDGESSKVFIYDYIFGLDIIDEFDKGFCYFSDTGSDHYVCKYMANKTINAKKITNFISVDNKKFKLDGVDERVESLKLESNGNEEVWKKVIKLLITESWTSHNEFKTLMSKS